MNASTGQGPERCMHGYGGSGVNFCGRDTVDGAEFCPDHDEPGGDPDAAYEHHCDALLGV